MDFPGQWKRSPQGGSVVNVFAFYFCFFKIIIILYFAERLLQIKNFLVSSPPPPQHKWAKTSLNNIEIARVSRMLHWLTASLCGSKWYYIKVPPCLNSTKTAWTLCRSCFSVRPILLVLILEAFNVFLQNYLKVAMMLWPLIKNVSLFFSSHIWFPWFPTSCTVVVNFSLPPLLGSNLNAHFLWSVKDYLLILSNNY